MAFKKGVVMLGPNKSATFSVLKTHDIGRPWSFSLTKALTTDQSDLYPYRLFVNNNFSAHFRLYLIKSKLPFSSILNKRFMLTMRRSQQHA